MSAPLALLGGLCAAQFLDRYWQKQPLLVRGALPDFVCPVSPEELAGLACEEDVESRLVMEKGGGRPWQVEHGPFSESRFAELPASHWTLLVQEINKHVPDFALLQERFGFLPLWRLDDVMVSFAPEYGTVGPHADNYDVFLIQGPGRRRWQLSRQPSGPEHLVRDLPLRILRDFVPEEEHVLEPGDLLYLPPGVVHHGVALEDCITISVGFRAPTETDLIAGFCADALAARDPERFYADPQLAPQANPGELDAGSRARIRALLRSLPNDDAALDEWLGRHLTDVRPGHYLPEPDAPLDAARLRNRLTENGEIWRSEYCRYAWYPEGDGVRLFFAGESRRLTAGARPAVELLTAGRVLPATELLPHLARDETAALFAELYNLGGIYFPEEA